MDTVNTIKLHSICPNLVKHQDVWSHFKPVKYNIDLNTVVPDSKDRVQLYLDILTYRVLEDLLKNPNLTPSSIEKVWSRLTDAISSDYRKQIVASWVGLCQMIDRLRGIFSGYDSIYQNLVYHKTARPQARRVELKIDALLKNSKGVDLLAIVPNSFQNQTMSGVSSPDTMFCLEYLEEAGIFVNKVIELSYGSGRAHLVREMHPTVTTRTYMNRVVSSINNSTPNPFYCNECPYKDVCTFKDRI